MYIVTRKDLSPGAKAAQCCHALKQFGVENPQEDDTWFQTSNYLVLLETEDEESLQKLLSLAEMKGIKFSFFREPDFDNAITAAAFEPGGKTKRLCSKLKLALS